MTQIVMIEDHSLFREGLKCLLEDTDGLRVVGESAEGRIGIELVEKLKPDLVLLGLILRDGLPGLEVLRHLRSTTKLLVISMRTDEAFVVEAFLNGADGYVVKADSFCELQKAIKVVMNGHRFMSSRLNGRRIGGLLERARKACEGAGSRLTSREQQVLRLTAEGFTSQQAAQRLAISPRTVEMHRGNMMHKLGLQGTAEVVRFAIRHKVIPA